MEVTNHPRLVISQYQDRLIKEIVKQAVDKGFGECSWLGFGKPDQEDYILIDEIHSPAQENTPGNSEMDEEQVHRVCMDMIEKGLRLLWWGHSHARMSTFFSGTDEATWKMFTSGKPPIFIATVHNYKQEKTYDRLYWNGLDLKGSGQLIHVMQPTVDEDDLKAHTSNWRKPKLGVWPKHTPGKQQPSQPGLGFASGTKKRPGGNTKRRRTKSSQSSSGIPGGKSIVWTPLTHDGEESGNFFEIPPKFIAPGATPGLIVGRICEECQILQVATVDEVRSADYHSCSLCNHQQVVSKRIFKHPNNMAKLIEAFSNLMS